MSENAIIVTSGAFIAPVVDVRSALIRYQAMKDFISEALRKSIDYGAIPGTDKPTLLKPGAEKLSTFFGLAPTFSTIEKELDWTGEHHGGEPFFYFHYRCRLMRGDILAAESEGSASSWEKKYRYRLADLVCPSCGKPTIKRSKFPPRDNPRGDPGWYCHDKAGGCGAQFTANDKRIIEQPRGQVKNPDVADIVNTLQKMAQKRAFVAAVLLAVNGSEYFTQDMEDFYEGDYQIVQSSPSIVEEPSYAIEAPAPKPQPEPAPEVSAPISITAAEAVTNSDGVRYGDLDNETLSHMTIGIGKGLKKADLTPEQREEYQYELAAIKTILSSRNRKG